jgi:protein SCO1/2
LRRLTLLLAAAAVGLAAGGVAIALALGTGGEGSAHYRGTIPPKGISLPAFALRDQRGRLVRSGALHGKAVAVTFLDTRCREACPIIANRAADGIRLLGQDDRKSVAAYAITVDPMADTPSRARLFLRRHHAVGTLDYLVGPSASLPRVWRAFQVLSAVRTGNASIHSAPVRIYDRSGEWVSTLYPGVDLTPANLAHDLRAALAEG